MPVNVYSTCFCGYATADTPMSYGVPVGKVAVLKDMVFWLPRGHQSFDESALVVELDHTGVNVWDIYGLNAPPGTYHWVGTQTFTEYLLPTIWHHPFAFRASGYLLTLP